MYNLLVSGVEGAWNSDRYEYELSRFGEYTSEVLKERYRNLNSLLIEELISFPALFAYENGHGVPARVGYIRKITQTSDSMRIKFEFVKEVQPISPEILARIAWDLDIKKMEMNRTHWALKDVDLYKVLEEAGILKDKESLLGLVGAQNQFSVYSQNNLVVNPIVFAIPRIERCSDLVSVMMPFSSEFNVVYAAIQSACTTTGMRYERADDVWEDSTIIQDIFNLIYRSTVVVVDLTGRNSNVLYETGIAHTLGRPVIPISQSIIDLPFDLAHHRTLRYCSTESGLIEMQKKLERRLRSLIG